MNIVEVGKLLLFASGLDRWVQVDQVTTHAWFRVLDRDDVTYPLAEQACIDHYSGPEGGRPFTVAHVIGAAATANRSTAKLVEADIRSARARGLVDAGWPHNEPLPFEVLGKLRAAREADRTEAARYSLEPGRIEHVDYGLTFQSGVM